jgi:hypothetical protein
MKRPGGDTGPFFVRPAIAMADHAVENRDVALQLF